MKTKVALFYETFLFISPSYTLSHKTGSNYYDYEASRMLPLSRVEKEEKDEE
jgi:hypothetical protein